MFSEFVKWMASTNASSGNLVVLSDFMINQAQKDADLRIFYLSGFYCFENYKSSIKNMLNLFLVNLVLH